MPQLWSDIGGTLGLWLGFSLLTTFEIIELISDLFVFCGVWLFNRTSPQNKVADGNVPSGGCFGGAQSPDDWQLQDLDYDNNDVNIYKQVEAGSTSDLDN